MMNVGDLLDLLAEWVPDEGARTRVLVDNAHRLYGFSAARRRMSLGSGPAADSTAKLDGD